MADTRTYIRLHDGMPDHPKVDGLSDKAFRLLVESWCWCSRHLTDGVMPGPAWRKRATPKARRELEAAGLARLEHDGTVRFHDYLEHQRSAEEVEEIKAARSEGGSYGGHVRWHVRRRIVRDDCEHCRSETHRSTYRSSHSSSYSPSHAQDPENGSQNGNAEQSKRPGTRENSPENRTDETTGHDQPTSGNAIAGPIGDASLPDSKTMASTSTETEGTTSGSSYEGSLSRHSSGSRRASENPDDDLDHAIAGLVEQHTGRPCPPDHAAAVRRQILDGRDVERPLPYVVKAIRENPARYMPPAPPTPPRAEPWMAVPDLGQRDNGAVNAAGRARVEAAIAAARKQPDQPEETDQ